MAEFGDPVRRLPYMLHRLRVGLGAYEMRMAGMDWPAIGWRLGVTDASGVAKRFAAREGLPWPPPSDVAAHPRIGLCQRKAERRRLMLDNLPPL